MDRQPILKSKLANNITTGKRIVYTEEMTKRYDHVYRSNPYPSKLEFEFLCKDLRVPIERAKNWFCNRRRRDLKEGKLCRKCRFFKAPVSEESHDAVSRPCITYWKLPTVAPPPMTSGLTTSGNGSFVLDESIEKKEEPLTKIEIDGNLPTYFNNDTDPVVPTAFSLTFQPGTYNFQQPIFNHESNFWYPQYHDDPYPVDVTAGNNMMRSAGTGQSSYWPMSFYNYCQQDFPQVEQLSCDWRQSQVQPPLPSYAMSLLPYAPYPQYMYSDISNDIPNDAFDYNEQNGTWNN